MSEIYVIGDSKLPLHVEYQPVIKVDAPHPYVCAYECLLRIGPNTTDYTTTSLISDAEANGTMPELDLLVIKQACNDALANSAMHIWLNLSQTTLSSRKNLQIIAELILSQRLADRVTIEMTETFDGVDSVVTSNLTWLKRQELTVVIDDIDDSFAKAHLLKTDLVAGCKFSRLSTIEIIGSIEKFEVAAKIVRWSKQHGKTVVLEGIETEEEFRLAVSLGVDFCQGFLFWPSLPIHALPQPGTLVSMPCELAKPVILDERRMLVANAD